MNSFIEQIKNMLKQDIFSNENRLKTCVAFYLVIVVIAAEILASPILGFIFLVWSLICILIFSVIKKFGAKKIPHSMEVITSSISQYNIRIPGNMPLPYAIFGKDNKILLYNEDFMKIFSDRSISGNTIFELFKDYKFHINKQVLKLNEKIYEVYSKKCELIDDTQAEHEYIFSICLSDISENENLRHELESQKPAVALLFLDNFEDVTDSLEESQLPLLTALIDRKLTNLSAHAEGILRKFEKDRYLFLLSHKKLEELKEKKFEILNEIRETTVGEHIPITLSMGIGSGSETLEIAMKNAKIAIELALGRGGDQVLIKEAEKYLFYGGKSAEVSRNARIRARVKADALLGLMTDSEEIFVMGHKQADLDSLGSCIGIFAIAKSLGKPCYIVMDTVSVGVKRIHERMASSGDYSKLFVTAKEALSKMTEKSLVIVTDTHRHSMVESPTLLKESKKIIVFDHHRKSTDFIEKAVLIYHEPYASSTSELVTEMIQYFGEKVKLKPLEADSLLAGITVDTKGFCVKTGAITFEAAAYLRRHGADSTRVRLLFQNDMAAYKAKATAIKDAEVFRGNIAISVCPSNVENSTLTAAQAADDLLNVVGIVASFVSCQIGDTIYISARSLGEINVQRIMETLGGGGHMTVSGAQLQSVTLEEASENIKNAIDYYLKEEN